MHLKCKNFSIDDANSRFRCSDFKDAVFQALAECGNPEPAIGPEYDDFVYKEVATLGGKVLVCCLLNRLQSCILAAPLFKAFSVVLYDERRWYLASTSCRCCEIQVAAKGEIKRDARVASTKMCICVKSRLR